MKKSATRLMAALAISSLPMASITTAAVVVSANAAFAAGKPDKAGKPESAGKPDKAGKPASAGKSDKAGGKEASARKGLNSLRRNINGLMNSSDPKMAGFRNYLLANEALAGVQDLFDVAQGEFDQAKTNYDALELSGDTTADLAALQGELDGLVAPDPETATEEEINAYNAQVTTLTTAIATVQTYVTEEAELAIAAAELAEATKGTTEEDMLQAFVEAMHASGQTDFEIEDITDDMLEMFQSHIDNYLN
jgi:hypothetical protein